VKPAAHDEGEKMKKVTFFYVRGCPYCRQAREVRKELIGENPAYAEIPFEEIDEGKERALADQYDYYYTPAMFLGKEKLYEAHPGESRQECRENMRKVLEQAYLA
jgi:glutaredoxin